MSANTMPLDAAFFSKLVINECLDDWAAFDRAFPRTLLDQIRQRRLCLLETGNFVQDGVNLQVL